MVITLGDVLKIKLFDTMVEKLNEAERKIKVLEQTVALLETEYDELSLEAHNTETELVELRKKYMGTAQARDVWFESCHNAEARLRHVEAKLNELRAVLSAL